MSVNSAIVTFDGSGFASLDPSSDSVNKIQLVNNDTEEANFTIELLNVEGKLLRSSGERQVLPGNTRSVKKPCEIHLPVSLSDTSLVPCAAKWISE